MSRAVLPALFLSASLFLPRPATAEDDDLVVLAYDVSDIVRKPRHFPAPKLGLQGIEEAEDRFVGDEDEGEPIHSVEDLVELIKKTIAPGTWDRGPHKITYSGTNIFITVDQHHRNAVTTVLDELRGQALRPVVIEAQVLALDAGQLAHVGFRDEQTRSRLISRRESAVLLEPILESANDSLGAPRLVAWENQRCHSVAVNQSAYVADVNYDAETGIVDPVIEILNEGITFEVVAKPRSGRKRMLLEWSVTLAHRADSQFEKTDEGVDVELPRIEKSISEGRGMVRADQLLLVRGLRSPEFGDGEGVLVLGWKWADEAAGEK